MGGLPYHQISYYPPDHKIQEEYLHEFSLIAQAVSGVYASADYDYARASAELSDSTHNTQPYPEAQKKGISTKTSNNDQEDNNKDPQTARQTHQIYDYAADVVQPEAGPDQDSNDAIGEQALRNRWNLERIQQKHVAPNSGIHRAITHALKR